MTISDQRLQWRIGRRRAIFRREALSAEALAEAGVRVKNFKDKG